jgi:hypothetical protein
MKRFRHAVEAGDVDAAIASLAEDVVFRSPVVFREYQGREVVGTILRAVFGVFKDFRYDAELHGDGQTALVFRAKVGEKDLHGIDLGEVNAAGEVTRLTVFVRPFSAATALKDAMQAALGGLVPPAAGGGGG